MLSRSFFPFNYLSLGSRIFSIVFYGLFQMFYIPCPLHTMLPDDVDDLSSTLIILKGDTWVEKFTPEQRSFKLSAQESEDQRKIQDIQKALSVVLGMMYLNTFIPHQMTGDAPPFHTFDDAAQDAINSAIECFQKRNTLQNKLFKRKKAFLESVLPKLIPDPAKREKLIQAHHSLKPEAKAYRKTLKEPYDAIADDLLTNLHATIEESEQEKGMRSCWHKKHNTAASFHLPNPNLSITDITLYREAKHTHKEVSKIHKNLEKTRKSITHLDLEIDEIEQHKHLLCTQQTIFQKHLDELSEETKDTKEERDETAPTPRHVQHSHRLEVRRQYLHVKLAEIDKKLNILNEEEGCLKSHKTTLQQNANSFQQELDTLGAELKGLITDVHRIPELKEEVQSMQAFFEQHNTPLATLTPRRRAQLYERLRQENQPLPECPLLTLTKNHTHESLIEQTNKTLYRIIYYPEKPLQNAQGALPLEVQHRFHQNAYYWQTVFFDTMIPPLSPN